MSTTVVGSPIPRAWALLPILVLVGALLMVLVVLPRSVAGFEGSAHVPLILAAAVAGLVARAHGASWQSLELGIVHTIGVAMPALLILIAIGMLIGVWIDAGVVPTLIHGGLALLSPRWFLPAACAICSAVSLVTGSSWSTAGTVGLALIGIGSALGVDPAMTAGAVVSGAYLGDKLSPLSDTTNLAPAVAGTDLFSHVRHMLWTTVPSWIVAMVVYGFLGPDPSAAAPPELVAQLRAVIARHYDPGLEHLLPLVGVIGLVVARVPALPSLLAGVALAAVVGAAHGRSAAQLLTAAYSGHRATTGDATVDALLSRGGLDSMGDTVLLIVCAMSFGGIMERTGMLQSLATALLGFARSTGSLIATTVLTCIGTNLATADQYIAIVLPGRLLAPTYRARGLDPKNLSRALEDGGTVTSALVPWNTCGAFMATTLSVATSAYVPYAFLNLLTPLLSMIYGFTGFTIARSATAPGERP